MPQIKLPSRLLRTPGDLSKFLLDELGWRRKELKYYRSLVDHGRGPVDALARGAVALLYAHWEGFVKVSSSAYIEHVRLQGKTLENLRSNFVALSSRKVAERAWQSNRWRFQIEFCDAVLACGGKQAQWSKGWTVDTASNLSVDVFRDVVALLGIAYRADFSIAEKPIIERLLELRNGIAHGESQDVDLAEYRQLGDKIDELLQLFCNDLDNAAATQAYCREKT